MNVLRMIPNVFLLVEGRTEETYLSHLKKRNSNYSLHVERFDGNQPMKMVKRCIARFKEKGMSKRDGDLAFCVMDVDDNTIEDLEKAFDYADAHNVKIIISNPCFEVFFLFHYVNEAKTNSSREMKEEVSKYIKGYSETKDCWNLLSSKRDKALKRSHGFTGLHDIRENKIGSNIWLLFDTLEEMSKRNSEV